MREQVYVGMKTLSEKQGKDRLPAAPPPNPVAVPGGQPHPIQWRLQTCRSRNRTCRREHRQIPVRTIRSSAQLLADPFGQGQELIARQDRGIRHG
jgi:hypothetical protein